MAIIGGLFLWLLRLALAPPSTIAGFRRWALDECPVAPGRKARAQRAAPTAHPPGAPTAAPALDPRRRDQQAQASKPGCSRSPASGTT